MCCKAAMGSLANMIYNSNGGEQFNKCWLDLQSEGASQVHPAKNAAKKGCFVYGYILKLYINRKKTPIKGKLEGFNM